MTRTDLLRIACFERVAADPEIEKLLTDLLEVTYQQGKVDGIREHALKGGACMPKADDVPAPCADGWRKS